MTLNNNKVPLFLLEKQGYQYFDVCCPKTSSCASKPLLLRCNLVIPQCMRQVLLRLKEVQMGTHDFKNITRCLFLLENREYQYFDVCCPETSSCASKPLLLRCNLVILQCMCQVSLRLKEVQYCILTRVSSWMENPYGKSIWIFFSKILFFLICFNTYEL